MELGAGVRCMAVAGALLYLAAPTLEELKGS